MYVRTYVHMFYVNNAYTDTSVSAHVHTFPQLLLFHREFYSVLNSYAGNCPRGRAGTVELCSANLFSC